LRSASPDDAGGADASTGAGLAVQIIIGELRRLKGAGPLDAETGQLVALYARTLSGIEQARARRGAGRGDLADKSTEELLEMALELPEVRDAMRRQHP
jgi:hypothetical protein